MSRPVRAQKAPSPEYLRLWRIIDGAVRDTFASHPEYLSGRVDLRLRIPQEPRYFQGD